MRVPFFSSLCLLVIGVSAAVEFLAWAGEASSRDHAAAAFDLSRSPLDTVTLDALERLLGKQAVPAALALEHVVPGDDLFVMTSDAESRDAAKKARALSVALRSLLPPSKVSVLRGLSAARPRALKGDVLWLLQLGSAHEAGLLAFGLERIEERGDCRLWKLGADE